MGGSWFKYPWTLSEGSERNFRNPVSQLLVETLVCVIVCVCVVVYVCSCVVGYREPSGKSQKVLKTPLSPATGKM